MPIGWGAFVWFMAWGYGSTLIPYYPLNLLMRAGLAYTLIIAFFGKALDKAQQKYHPRFFNYRLPLPSWRIFVIAVFVGIIIFFTPVREYALIESLVLGILLSSITEELITRSMFVKYKMNLLEFIFFNIISSFAFTYMHAFYEQNGVALMQLIQNGHFQFSFILGILVYNTKRIELTILLHVLSNLFRYTIPVCLLYCPWPSPIAITLSLAFDILFYLCLGGCFLVQAKPEKNT